MVKKIAIPLCAAALCAFGTGRARAQAGPPFLTNDPGTPGNANWEINVGSMQTLARGVSSYQVPQLDLNFGVGDRIQLTYEVPYILQTSSARPLSSGWGNGYPGIKWRFLDQGDGWQMSVFPQVETGASLLAREKGIAEAGPRYLLPVADPRSTTLDLGGRYKTAPRHDCAVHGRSWHQWVWRSATVHRIRGNSVSIERLRTQLHRRAVSAARCGTRRRFS